MKDTKSQNGTDLKGFVGHSVTLSNEIDDGDTYILMTLELVFMNMRRYLANQELNNLVRPDLGY